MKRITNADIIQRLRQNVGSDAVQAGDYTDNDIEHAYEQLRDAQSPGWQRYANLSRGGQLLNGLRRERLDSIGDAIAAEL